MVRGVRETRGTQRIRLSRICPRDPRVQDQEFKDSSEFMGRLAGGAAGSVFWGSRGRGRRL